MDDPSTYYTPLRMSRPWTPGAAAAGGPALVQDTGIQTGAGVAADSAAFGSNVTAGNFIAVGVALNNIASVGMNDCTDTLTNNYVIAGSEPTWFPRVAVDECAISLWYAENIAGGACTVTVDPVPVANNYLAWCAAEFSGVKTSTSLDQVAATDLSNTTTDANITSGSTTQATELVLAVASVAEAGAGGDNVNWGAAATTGYTNIAQYPDFANIETISFDYKIVTSTGTQSADWSHDPCNGQTYDGWGCVIATFKAA